MNFLEFHACTGLEKSVYEKLCGFRTLLTSWNQAYNLVQKDSLKDFWTRHVLDSLELRPFLQDAPEGSIVDLGTGAGFPGIVLACAGITPLVLVESIQKKCSFLTQVQHELSLPVTILCQRAETLSRDYKTFIARALAPIDKLLDLALTIRPQGDFYFYALKGPKAVEEVEKARDFLTFHATIRQGHFSPTTHVVQIHQVQKKGRDPGSSPG